MKFGSNKTAIVIGANGFIGQNLCYWLAQNKVHIIAVSRQPSFKAADYVDSAYLKYIQADVSVKEEVEKLPLQNADVIYMMAGRTGTTAGFNQYESYVQSNEVALLHLLSVYVQQKANARIVFPSSRLVYKGIKGTLLKEGAEKEAKTMYAANKLACENYLYAWGNAFDIPYSIFRICVPYGQLLPGNYSYGTLGFMLKQATENKQITLFGEGEPARTFTHMADICEVLGQVPLLEATKGCTLNIGSNDHLQLHALAAMIAEKYKAEVSYKPWPQLDKAVESGDTMFDDSRLQSLFSYSYTGNLQQYISEL